MPRQCNTCAHVQAGQIAKVIAEGGSNAAIARRFGVTESSVQRHRVKCLRAPRRTKEPGNGEAASGAGASVRFEKSRGAISSPKDLLDRLSTLFRLGDLLEEAYERRDVDACVKLAREYRAAAESYAKVAGWLVEGGSNTTIDNRKQVIAVLSQLGEEELRTLIASGGTPPIPAAQALESKTETPFRD